MRSPVYIARCFVFMGWLIALPYRGAADDDTAPVLPAEFDNRVAGEPSGAPYWEQFNDSALNELVERGLSGNFDVEAAKHRIAQAEAVARQTLAPLLPSVSAEAGWSLRPFDSVGLGVSTPTTPNIPSDDAEDPAVIHSVSTVLSARYLVDITGRYYTTRQASLLDAAASQADAETQARVDDLADKANEGTLSDQEKAEYRQLVEAFDIITILQAKARSLLDKQPSS